MKQNKAKLIIYIYIYIVNIILKKNIKSIENVLSLLGLSVKPNPKDLSMTVIPDSRVMGLTIMSDLSLLHLTVIPDQTDLNLVLGSSILSNSSKFKSDKVVRLKIT